MAIPTPSTMTTVAMPVRNEAVLIGRNLTSVLAQDYSMSQVGVSIVGGMSEDGTRLTVHVRRHDVLNGTS